MLPSPLSRRRAIRLCASLAPALLLPAAYADAGLRTAATEQARFVCTADVARGALACTPLVPTSAPALTIQQAASARPGTWSPEMRLRAPASGAALTGLHLRVLGAPVTSRGTGSVRAVAAGDAVAHYAGVLAPGATSAARPWAFDVDAGVEAFTVQVAVVGAAVLLPLSVSTTPEQIGTPGDVDATARVLRNSRGVRIPIAEVGTWSSSDPSVATVNEDGEVTRVDVGTATIRYTVNGRTVQETTVQVCPTLAVGGVYHFTALQATQMCLQGTSGTTEYTLIATNQNAGIQRTVSVTATGIQSVTGPPTPFVGDVDAATVSMQDAPVDATALDVRPLDSRPAGLHRAGPAAYPVRSLPSVGDPVDLNTSFSCTAPQPQQVLRGIVRAVSDRAIVVVDTLNPAYTPNTTSP